MITRSKTGQKRVTGQHVISTEVAHNSIVRCAAERPLYFAVAVIYSLCRLKIRVDPCNPWSV
jgi:hypothetical protein